jgi:hypothetical protein
LSHPGPFLHNIVSNLLLTVEKLAVLPIGVLALAGTFGAGRRTETRWPLVVLVLTALALALATSLAFMSKRLVLPMVPALAILAGCGLAQIRSPTFWLLIVAVTGFSVNHDLPKFRDWRAPSYLTEVSEALHSAGLRDASQALSLDFPYYELQSPDARMFERPWFYPENLSLGTIADIERLMRQRGWVYLVFNDRAASLIRSLRDWPPPKVPDGFEEILASERELHGHVWRLRQRVP